jgi:hypothetical protein
MFTNAQIFEASRTLRSDLAEVLDDIQLAQQVDIQLAELLNQTELEENAKADGITDILDGHPKTKDWLDGYLNSTQTRGFYDPLAGDPALLKATKYVCPIANDYTWYGEVGSDIRDCPTHLVSLVPAQS